MTDTDIAKTTVVRPNDTKDVLRFKGQMVVGDSGELRFTENGNLVAAYAPGQWLIVYAGEYTRG